MRTPTREPAGAQQPEWPDSRRVPLLRAELARRAPLVDLGQTQRFAELMGKVAGRDAIVVQGGDCAELFADADPTTVRRKLAQLEQVARTLGNAAGLETLRVGRMAGQYAKPRSSDVEHLPNGSAVRSYRGDAVNGAEPEAAARVPDPIRLLEAYDNARRTLTEVGRHNVTRADMDRVYVSHEALLLDYERPLVRHTEDVSFAASAHFPWIGERTRDPDGPHAELLAGLANSIGVKIGPTISPDDAVRLSRRLNPDGVAGKLAFIVRLGANEVDRLLPDLVAAVIRRGAPVVWLCDPMHGNTVRTATGKVRFLDAINAELAAFVRVLKRGWQWPAGIHLEMTPDDVVECVPDAAHAGSGIRYRSACDPRLNPVQAVEVVRRFAELL